MRFGDKLCGGRTFTFTYREGVYVIATETCARMGGEVGAPSARVVHTQNANANNADA